MHDKHIMIDLETLSTENDAAIIAIGVVEFDLERVWDERLWLIDPVLSTGRRDTATIKWWHEQNPEVRLAMFSGVQSDYEALRDLWSHLNQFWENHWIWAGPSTFDLAILKTRYQELGINYPINWRNQRDLTTLSRVAEQLGIDMSGDTFKGFVEHNPVSDSIKQARRAQIILKAMARQWDTRDDAERGKPVFGSMDGNYA